MAMTAAQLSVEFQSRGAEKVKGDLRSLDDATNAANSGFQRFQQGMLAVGTALIAPMAVGLRAAADMEQAMANVNATLGGVDTSQLDALEQGFMDIGAASQYSAVEVAAVGDEIARAGFDTDQIVGMTQAVVDLSQATGSDLMTAVSGVTAVMQIWSPAIVDSTIALTDASRAADIFTVAANASSADVQDIIAGMRNFGPTAASIGVGFEEASGAIAMFTNYGIKAADAGVSLTRSIENLQNPTAEAQAVMDEFGITVFDMQGNFVGLPALFDQLNTAFADMTPEARNAALSVLFGAEALDVMTIAAMTGGDPLRAIMELMGETGVAAEQSALRMDTLKAQFGELVESVTNLLGRLAGGLIPGLRMLVDGANAVVDVFSRIPSSILAVVGTFAGLLAGIAAVTQAIRGFALLNSLFAGAGIGGGLLGGLSLGPLLAFGAGIAAVAAAIKFNLFGITDALQRFIDAWNAIGSTTNNPISRFMSSLVAMLDPTNTATGILGDFADFLDDWSKRIENSVDRVQDAWELLFGDGATRDAEENAEKQAGAAGVMSDMFGNLQDNLGGTAEPLDALYDSARKLINPMAEVGDEADATAGYVDDMTRAAERSAYPVTTVGRVLAVVGEAFRGADFPGIADAFTDMGFTVDELATNFQAFRDQGLNPVSAGLLALGQTFPSLQTAMVGLHGVVTGLGDAFVSSLRGDWEGVFEGLEQAAASAGVVIGELGSALGGLVVDLASWTINVGVPAVTGWIADNAGDIGSAILTAAGWVVDNIIVPLGAITLQIGGWLVESAESAWEHIKNWVLGRAGGLQGGGGAAGGAAVRAAGGSIPIGPVAIQITDWIVETASDLRSIIVQKVNGWIFGSGLGGGGGAAASAVPGGGIPLLSAITIKLEQWEIVGDAANFWTSLTDWVDEQITVTDAEAAAFEPKGREIGRGIMASVLDGINWALDLDNILTGGDGRSSGGGGGGPIAAGGSFGGGLGRYIMPILDGMWDELQPELENWGTQFKRDMQQWWNGFAPTLLQFDTLAGSPLQQGGDAAFGGVLDAVSGPSMFDRLRETIEGKWEDFTGWLDGFDFSIDMPSIDIDWGSFGENIGEGWQNTITLFDNIIEWVKNPWQNVGSIDIDFPSISIDWPDIPDPPDDLVDFLTDPIGYITDKARGGDGAAGSQGSIREGFEQTLDTINTLVARVIDAGARIGASLSASGGFGGPKTMVLPDLAGDIERMMLRAQAAAANGLAAVGSTIRSAAAGWAAAIPPLTITVTADTAQATTAMDAARAMHVALNGTTSTVHVDGDNAGALAAVSTAAGAIGAINGMAAMTFVQGDPSGAISAAGAAAGAIASVDGMTATGYINAVNNVGGAVGAAMAALMSIDGMTATTYINVVSSGAAGIGQRLASGGTVDTPLQLVGEHGPELVSLPYGSYVHNASRSGQMLDERRGGGDTFELHIHGNVYGVDDLADSLEAAMSQRRRGHGMAVMSA